MFKYDSEWTRQGHKSAEDLAEFWLSGRDLEIHEDWLQAQLAATRAPIKVTSSSKLNDAALMNVAARAETPSELDEDSSDAESSDGSTSWVWTDSDFSDVESVSSELQDKSAVSNFVSAVLPEDAGVSPLQLTLPPVPQGKRSIEELLDDSDIWNYSHSERASLVAAWRDEIRSVATDELLGARDAYESARAASEEYRSEVSRSVA